MLNKGIAMRHQHNAGLQLKKYWKKKANELATNSKEFFKTFKPFLDQRIVLIYTQRLTSKLTALKLVLTPS